MTDPNPLTRLLLILVLLGTNVAAAEDTLYVTDRVLADLRAQPAARGELLERLPTGTAVRALYQDGPYLKVRAPDGVVGWVLRGKVQNEEPARLVLPELTEKHERTTAELNRVRAELQAVRERIANAGLPWFLAVIPTWLVSTLFGAMAVLGFVLGVLWLDWRHRHRHGGFRV